MSPEELKEEFERQAEWRREKAAQYPNDERNAEAAAIFDRLASSVAACPAEVIQAVGELFDDLPDTEIWIEKLKLIGFYDRRSAPPRLSL